MFLNLHYNSEHVDVVINSTGRLQENRIFRFLKIHKKYHHDVTFVQIEIFFQ